MMAEMFSANPVDATSSGDEKDKQVCCKVDQFCMNEKNVNFSHPEGICLQSNSLKSMPLSNEVNPCILERGAHGLYNLGNTCFMNAGLQCLFAEPSLVNFFLQLPQNDLKSLVSQFQQLLGQVWTSENGGIHPVDFHQALYAAHPQFKDFRQHDCQEFIALFLDTLHQQLESNNLSNHSPSSECSDSTVLDTCCQESVSSSVPSPAHDDASLRHLPIPDYLKAVDSHSHALSSDTAEEIQEIKEPVDNNSLSALADIYCKESRVKNTNVLASEDVNSLSTTDSSKFQKLDNCQVAAFDSVENLGNFSSKKSPPIDAAVESCHPHDEQSQIGVNVKRPRMDLDVVHNNLLSDVDTKSQRNDEKNVIASVEGSQNALEPSSGNVASSEFMLDMQRNINSAAALEGDTGSRESIMEESGEEAWQRLNKDKSVVMDTFQGQFQDEIVCQRCQYVSITYEPFMYLPVPVPHAMERQIEVTFIWCDNREATRYLVTLFKQDSVLQLKENLYRLLDEETLDVVVAEVFDNHLSRILEDHMLLRYVNDKNRLIYAFEMMPVSPELESPSLISSVNEGRLNNANITWTPDSLSSIAQENSSDSMKVQLDADDLPLSSGINSLVDEDSMEYNYNSRQINNSPVSQESLSFSVLNNAGFTGETFDSEGTLMSSLTSIETLLSEAPGKNFRPDNSSCFRSGDRTDDGLSPSEEEDEKSHRDHGGETKMDQLDEADNFDGDKETIELAENMRKTHEVSENCAEFESVEATSHLTSVEEIAQQPMDSEREASVESVQPLDSGWKSCVVCLEEMSNAELLTHTSCGGLICCSCLDRMDKHYSAASFPCPVCHVVARPSEDFPPLSVMGPSVHCSRVLTVPLVLSCLKQTSRTRGLFGHPNVLYLPSSVSTSYLYSSVDRVVRSPPQYTLLLTDGQGLHCSRCLYTQHCTGCELSREGTTQLLTGDHLAVFYSEIDDDLCAKASITVDHVSMNSARNSTVLTLTDCFKAFTQTEDLDEENPWYCPRCNSHQCAQKTITIWRWPRTLVVYIKRFLFHKLCSSKIGMPVQFPLNDLCLEEFMSGPDMETRFRLQGCVCHFGGVNAGHYTAYTCHPNSRKWYYFNDENIAVQEPLEEDFSNAYMLFYQRYDCDSCVDLREKLD